MRGLDLLGVSADEAIFVDDREANVKGAEDCGIRSLLFSDTPSFASDLDGILNDRVAAQ